MQEAREHHLLLEPRVGRLAGADEEMAVRDVLEAQLEEVSAVILWNTRYLQAALADMSDRGMDVRPELVRHVAPLGWEHIGLTGDYVWGRAVAGRSGELPPCSRRGFPVRSHEPDNMITFASSPHSWSSG